MYEYLVSYQGRNKLIVLNRKENFMTEVEKKFAIVDRSCLSIQLFHEGFKEFFEIDVSELPDSGKISLAVQTPVEYSLR